MRRLELCAVTKGGPDERVRQGRHDDISVLGYVKSALDGLREHRLSTPRGSAVQPLHRGSAVMCRAGLQSLS